MARGFSTPVYGAGLSSTHMQVHSNNVIYSSYREKVCNHCVFEPLVCLPQAGPIEVMLRHILLAVMAPLWDFFFDCFEYGK